jgi:hypothetical protein
MSRHDEMLKASSALSDIGLNRQLRNEVTILAKYIELAGLYPMDASFPRLINETAFDLIRTVLTHGPVKPWLYFELSYSHLN